VGELTLVEFGVDSARKIKQKNAGIIAGPAKKRDTICQNANAGQGELSNPEGRTASQHIKVSSGGKRSQGKKNSKAGGSTNKRRLIIPGSRGTLGCQHKAGVE